MNSATIAVIGKGIIGVCIAEKLIREGFKVTLIGDDQPGESCSTGNAGHFASDIVLPLANWRTLLKVPLWLMNEDAPLSIQARYLPSLTPWLTRYAINALPGHGQRSTAALKALNRPSIKLFRDLLARHQLQSLMTEKGALTVYCQASSLNAITRHQRAVSTHGVNVKLLNEQQTQELEPALAGRIKGALYYPDTAHTANPEKMLVALTNRIAQQGCRLLTDRICQVSTNHNGVLLTSEDGSHSQFDQVIIAAGIGSKALLQPLNYRVPLEAERGYHLQLKGQADKLNRPVTVFENSFVLTPMEEGLRLAGTVELASKDAPPNYKRSQRLLGLAQKLLPELDAEQSTQWMGRRPSFPDSLPMIGRCPRHQNVIAAFGHQHLGLTQAAVTAEWVSDLLNRPASFDWYPPGHPELKNTFAVDRF